MFENQETKRKNQASILPFLNHPHLSGQFLYVKLFQISDLPNRPITLKFLMSSWPRQVSSVANDRMKGVSQAPCAS